MVSQPKSKRVFFGFSIPVHIQTLLKEALKPYREAGFQIIHPDRWHITMLFLGEVADWDTLARSLPEQLPQSFVATLALTHIGTGANGRQLWGYVVATPALKQIRHDLIQSLQEHSVPIPAQEIERRFQPHVTVARPPKKDTPAYLPDAVVGVTFAAPKLTLFESTPHEEYGRAYTPIANVML